LFSAFLTFFAAKLTPPIFVYFAYFAVKNHRSSLLANSPLVSQIVFANNSAQRMKTGKTYDHLNRLTQISSTPSGTGILPVVYNHTYNLANQRTQSTFSDGSHWVYQYDPLGQVTTGNRYCSDGNPGHDNCPPFLSDPRQRCERFDNPKIAPSYGLTPFMLPSVARNLSRGLYLANSGRVENRI
jgi:hypothetical protein